MKQIHSLIRTAAAAIAAVATMAVPTLSLAGSVIVNATPVCVDTPTLSMDPAGNLTITCTAVPASGSTVTALTSCTVTSPVTTVGNTALLSASCLGGAATQFVW